MQTEVRGRLRPARHIAVNFGRVLPVAAVGLGLAIACGGSIEPSPSPGSSTLSAAAAATSSPAATTWRTDFNRLADGVAMSDFVRALANRDAIPALNRPALVDASAIDWLAGDEPVIAVERNREWRAYPLQIMLWHEIVNDMLGEEPIVVTFCPLCHTSVVFDARLDGVPLDFGVSGYLRRSDLVMYDRQSETWWQQATGIGLVGTHAGRALDFLPSSIVAWSDFLAAHPDAGVVDRATGHDRPYGRNPYPGWDSVKRVPLFKDAESLFCDDVDGKDCVDAKERVAVVRAGEETVVFRFRELAAKGGVVETDVGGVPVVVWWQPDVRTVLGNALIERSDQVGTAVAFDRRFEETTLTFAASSDSLVDHETGTEWNTLGEATTGRSAGAKLQRLEVDTPYWFGFAAFGEDYRVWSEEN